MAVRDQEGTKKEDLRQRRSKQHLTNALMELMEERSYGEISVVEICQRAMVHRTTFYAHFEDKDDLFGYVLQNMMDSFSKSWNREEYQGSVREEFHGEFRKVLTFFRTHRRLQSVGLSTSGTPQLRMMEDAIAEVLKQFILERSDGGVEQDAAMVWGRFYGGAILTTVNWWLENNMPVSEERLLQLLGELVPKNW